MGKSYRNQRRISLPGSAFSTLCGPDFMPTVKRLSDSLPLSTGTGSQCLRQVCVCSEQYKVSGVLHCSQANVARTVFPLQTAEENLTVSLQKPLSSELSDFNLYVSQKKCSLRVPGTKPALRKKCSYLSQSTQALILFTDAACMTHCRTIWKLQSCSC